MWNRLTGIGVGVAAVGLLCASGLQPNRVAALTETQRELLANSRYVYISSERKDGTFGAPAEIWFLFHDSAVWVGTTPASRTAAAS